MADEKIYRNVVIATRFLNGDRIVEIARDFGVSSGRVRDIVSQYCWKANKELYWKKPPGTPLPDLEWLRAHRHVFVRDMQNLLSVRN